MQLKSGKTTEMNRLFFFGFTAEIRKIRNTTNLIENLNGKIRKYTKNQLSFPTDDAVM
jgi:transposase-like protein